MPGACILFSQSAGAFESLRMSVSEKEVGSNGCQFVTLDGVPL